MQKIYTGKNVSRYTLEMHCNSHRFSHLCLKNAVAHVLYRLPHESAKIMHLLDTIKCSDADLRARISNINCNTDPNGKQHVFELAVVFILLACPVALCLAREDPIVKNKIAGVGARTLKARIGKTGVELRLYPRNEYT